jgi:hypothetical protein
MCSLPWCIITISVVLPKKILDSLTSNLFDPISFLTSSQGKTQTHFSFHEVTYNEVRKCFDGLRASRSRDIYALKP